MRKTVFLIAASVLMVLAGYAIATADEVKDLNTKKNQASLNIMQYNAQINLLKQQLQEYVIKFAEKKAELENNVDTMVKERQIIDQKIKALQQPAEPKE